MGKAFLFGNGGGGAALNFSVIGGTSQPSGAGENTIWIDTDTAITSYVFSAAQPASPEEGMVWVLTGNSSVVEFNALKKNALQVCPVSAKQYISGAWVEKTAKSYQGGAWVDWWNGPLYDYGNEYEAITGGWEAKNLMSGSTASGGSIVKNADSIQVINVGNGSWAAVTVNQIDLTNYTTLHVVYTCSSSGVRFAVSPDFPAAEASMAAVTTAGTASAPAEAVLDITAVNEPCRIGFQNRGTNTVHLYKAWIS